MLHDQVVFVTGAGSGIGRQLALEAARRGAAVWVTDLEAAAAAAVADECRAIGGRATSGRARTLDVTDAADVTRAIDEVVAADGRIDYCFNNAGIGFAGEFRDSSLDHWRRVMDVNLFGVIHVAHAAYRQMVRQGHGHLVNTASLAGLIPTPGLTAYGASKHAVVSLTNSLRLEGAALGVKVSAICPGFIESNIYRRTLVAGLKPDAMRTMAPFPIVPVEGLVTRVFAGLARNEALIVYPFYARALWWVWRLIPWATTWKGLAQVKKIRAEYRIVE
jgi:NAD(P)-dependent dehydrogenase (short-subunit alcohol dehydrogenase family)